MSLSENRVLQNHPKCKASEWPELGNHFPFSKQTPCEEDIDLSDDGDPFPYAQMDININELFNIPLNDG